MHRCRKILKLYCNQSMYLSSLLDRNIGCHLWTNIFGTRANEAIVGVLLEYMRCPAGDAAASKNGCIQIDWDTQCVVDGGRVEVNVGIQISMAFDIAFDDARHLIPSTIAGALAQLLGHCTQVRSTWVFGAIDAVPKAHDALMMFQRVLNEGLCMLNITDAQKHTHDLLVRASMQPTGERTDGRGDSCIHI